MLACSRIGAIANFLNPLFSKEQLIDRINETEAKWIFILDAMYLYVEAALQKTCIQLDIHPSVFIEQALRVGGPEYMRDTLKSRIIHFFTGDNFNPYSIWGTWG